MTKEYPMQKDRIDALVDNLDKYYFRMGAAQNMLSGSTYVKLKGYTNDVRGLFETAGAKEAREIFYEKAREAEAKNPGILPLIEDAALQWQSYEETFPMLLGYILGLRIAGMSSEQTKAMARTWRLGYPLDDRD